MRTVSVSVGRANHHPLQASPNPDGAARQLWGPDCPECALCPGGAAATRAVQPYPRKDHCELLPVYTLTLGRTKRVRQTAPGNFSSPYLHEWVRGGYGCGGSQARPARGLVRTIPASRRCPRARRRRLPDGRETGCASTTGPGFGLQKPRSAPAAVPPHSIIRSARFLVRTLGLDRGVDFP
jgi:hypothetical protein